MFHLSSYTDVTLTLRSRLFADSILGLVFVFFKIYILSNQDLGKIDFYFVKKPYFKLFYYFIHRNQNPYFYGFYADYTTTFIFLTINHFTYIKSHQTFYKTNKNSQQNNLLYKLRYWIFLYVRSTIF